MLPDSGEFVRLRPGDVAVLRGPEHYTVADDPATSPQVVIHPGQRCTAPDGSPLASMRDLGVRNWGNSQDGETVLVTGTYQLHSEVSRRLLAALPTLLVLTRESWHNPLTDYLAEEVATGRRPAPRARRHRRFGGPAGRLRQPVRVQRGVQASARPKPRRTPQRCRLTSGG